MTLEMLSSFFLGPHGTEKMTGYVTDRQEQDIRQDYIDNGTYINAEAYHNDASQVSKKMCVFVFLASSLDKALLKLS